MVRSLLDRLGGGHKRFEPCHHRLRILDVQTGKAVPLQRGNLQLGPPGSGKVEAPGLRHVITAGELSPDGTFILKLSEDTSGRLVRDGRTVLLEDLLFFGVRYGSGGAEAASVRIVPGTEAELDVAGRQFRIRWEPEPPPKYPVLPRQPRLRVSSRPVVLEEASVAAGSDLPFWNSLGLIAIACMFLFSLLNHMRMHYLPVPQAFPMMPPERIVRLYTEPLTLPASKPVAKIPEAPVSTPMTATKTAIPPPKAAGTVRDQVAQTGLIRVLAAHTPGVAAQVSAIGSSMDNIFRNIGPVSETGKAETDRPELGGYSDAGSLDGDLIAGLKPQIPKGPIGGTEVETVVSSAATGEHEIRTVRTMAEIAMVMQKYLPMFRSRHKRLLRTAPAAAGKMLIEFVIKADGSVASPNIKSSAFGKYPEFEKEILDVMLKIRFEAAGKGDVKVQFPLLFTVGG